MNSACSFGMDSMQCASTNASVVLLWTVVCIVRTEGVAFDVVKWFRLGIGLGGYDCSELFPSEVDLKGLTKRGFLCRLGSR